MINYNTTVQDELKTILTKYFSENSLIQLENIMVQDNNYTSILANYPEDIKNYNYTKYKEEADILCKKFKQKLTSEFEKLELYQNSSTPLGEIINQNSISRSLGILLRIPGEAIDDKTSYESFLLDSSKNISNVVLKFREIFQNEFKERDVKFNCLFQLNLYSPEEDSYSVKCNFYCRLFGV